MLPHPRRAAEVDFIDAPVEQENIGFRNLLAGILNAALHDYKSVEIGIAKSPYLAAWGARNLLELRVITIYILKSKRNAEDFKDDLLADPGRILGGNC